MKLCIIYLIAFGCLLVMPIPFEEHGANNVVPFLRTAPCDSVYYRSNEPHGFLHAPVIEKADAYSQRPIPYPPLAPDDIMTISGEHYALTATTGREVVEMSMESSRRGRSLRLLWASGVQVTRGPRRSLHGMVD